MSKVWFVTGSSRGFGREFVEAALSRGDKVAATARNPRQLDDQFDLYGDAVLRLELDVTNRGAVFERAIQAKEHFGRLDVVVNNAGYLLFGAIEELTEHQLRETLKTNLFGALSVIQATLPHLRKQGSGHIIQMSSIGGLIAMPMGGGYHASKWAVEAMNESLAQEVADFGISVTLVEPSAFATRSGGRIPNPLVDGIQAEANPIYDGFRQNIAGFMNKEMSAGDPAAAAQALLKIVDSDNPPLRVFFGTEGYQLIRRAYGNRVKAWTDWQDLSAEAHGKVDQVTE